MDTGTIIGSISTLIAVIAVIIADKQRRYQQSRDVGLDVVAIVQRISKLETSTDLAWKMLEMYAGKILHHPNTPQIDWYIDKNEVQGLTDVEAREFAEMLKNLVETSKSNNDRMAATLMLAAISYRYHLV